MGAVSMDRDVVLIVEDDANLRSMYAAWLSSDYDVRVAADAAEALRQFDVDVDLVLLDRNLPDRNGSRIVPTLRGRSHDCQIALLTAIEPDFDIMHIDFDAYITKPVREVGLRKLVDGLRSSREIQLAQEGELII